MFAKQLLTIDRCTGVAVVLAEASGKPRVITGIGGLRAPSSVRREDERDGEHKMKRRDVLAPGNVVNVCRQRSQRPLEAPRQR
jgi:hypothetical protein